MENQSSPNPQRLPPSSARGRAGSSSYESSILKALFINTVIPFVLLDISSAGSGFVDGLAVSQFLGTKDMAVQGLASPYYSITGIIAGLLVTGMQTLSAKAYGMGDSKRAEGYFSMAMIYTGLRCAAPLVECRMRY